MARIMYWDEIKNAKELRAELREMLINFMINANEHETDVYLYLDEETSTGELYEFVNVGGKSWLDDDHITIYTDHQHNEDMYDVYNNISEIAESVGMSTEEIMIKALERLRGIDEWYDDFDVDDITMQHVIDLINDDDDLSAKCAAWREDFIRDYCCDDIEDVIDEIIREYDDWTMECRMEQNRGY